jgi:hypothetical protein
VPALPLSFLSSPTAGVFSICFLRARVQVSIVAAASLVQTSLLQGACPWGQTDMEMLNTSRAAAYNSSSSCLCLTDLVVGLVLSSFHNVSFHVKFLKTDYYKQSLASCLNISVLGVVSLRDTSFEQSGSEMLK